MTQTEWLESKGFVKRGLAWKLGNVEIERCGAGYWVASIGAVRSHGSTPRQALLDLVESCAATAAALRTQASDLDKVATTIGSIL